jgi:hypothetical protein
VQIAKCKIENRNIIAATLSRLLLIVVVAIFLLGGNVAAQEQDERAALQAQQQTLRKKVAALKREQDFLLFQKEMYAADSKYLVLNIAEKSGQLKYKSRVLQSFQISVPKSSSVRSLQPGMLVLTKKAEDKKDRFTLMFGASLVLQWKRDGVSKREAGIPVFSLDEKEMLSIFLAVEEGALAYILR